MCYRGNEPIYSPGAQVLLMVHGGSREGGVAKLQNGGQETMTVVQLLEPIKKQAG